MGKEKKELINQEINRTHGVPVNGTKKRLVLE